MRPCRGLAFGISLLIAVSSLVACSRSSAGSGDSTLCSAAGDAVRALVRRDPSAATDAARRIRDLADGAESSELHDLGRAAGQVADNFQTEGDTTGPDSQPVIDLNTACYRMGAGG